MIQHRWPRRLCALKTTVATTFATFTVQIHNLRQCSALARVEVWAIESQTANLHLKAGLVLKPSQTTLPRVLGIPSAVLLGLGSILGTGVFVSIGIAADVAGHSFVLAVALAGVVAVFNGLSSAQLAASHSVSGGTYEYGYKYLNPALGFSAGWMFLCAKSASAATAALGLAGYGLSAVGYTKASTRTFLATLVVCVCTALVASGMRRSSRVNTVIVSTTILALVLFVFFGALTPGALPTTLKQVFNLGDNPQALLHATALMFVAYTGYGRVATLGEEVHNPRKNIPRAIVLTLAITVVLYVSVALAAVRIAGVQAFAAATHSSAAPLEILAQHMSVRGLPWIVSLGAITAMTGVLLNLVLGLSRVLLAMGRRGDMPRGFAALDKNQSPRKAVIAIGGFVVLLVCVGNIKTTWSFSAFTVLIYYAITNVAALRLPKEHRRYPRIIAWLGLCSCLGLAFWITPRIWLIGLCVMLVGLAWHLFQQTLRAPNPK